MKIKCIETIYRHDLTCNTRSTDHDRKKSLPSSELSKEQTGNQKPRSRDQTQSYHQEQEQRDPEQSTDQRARRTEEQSRAETRPDQT
ncbi:hypothetical protein EXIGLDRAFT_717256, partial [Exidia glandulosa HHB12029]